MKTSSAMGTIRKYLARAVALACVSTFVLPVAAGMRQPTTCQSFKLDDLTAGALPKDVRKALCEYYDAENARRWHETYAMRPAGFRDAINYALYRRTMSKESRAFVVSEIRVKEVREVSGARTKLLVDFYEMPEGSRSEYTPMVGFASMGESVVLESESGWKCVSCGMRGRFTLNVAIGY